MGVLAGSYTLIDTALQGGVIANAPITTASAVLLQTEKPLKRLLHLLVGRTALNRGVNEIQT